MHDVSNSETEVKQLVERWAEAVRNGDIDAIIAHHSEDIVMFDVPEPFESIGIDAYRGTWELFFRYTRSGVFDIKQLSVTADENIAFCIATMQCCDKSSSDDFVPLDFRLTIGLKKIKGQWTIVHEHHSVPAK